MALVYQPTLDSDGSYMPPKLTLHDVRAARKIYGPRREPYNNGIGILSGDENSNVETTTYIVPTEVISTTTQTEVNSNNECPDNGLIHAIASEEVTYIIRRRDVYKIQNQRVVKTGPIGDFFQWNASLDIHAGYIRNGSLILLDYDKQVYVYDPIPMQSDKFTLRKGFPKKTPIDMGIRGAIMINDKAYVFSWVCSLFI
uniref:Uncharacterized protein n=1 Tax=Acrobeloides nanus TaxID=290746 RepID=A0A914EC87_9BILA